MSYLLAQILDTTGLKEMKWYKEKSGHNSPQIEVQSSTLTKSNLMAFGSKNYSYWYMPSHRTNMMIVVTYLS